MATLQRPKVKCTTLPVRIDPTIKAAAEAAAVHEFSSPTTFLEVLIVNHYRTSGLNPEHFARESRQ